MEIQVGILFACMSFMMLANGMVLAIVSREFPASLRPSATFWQCGVVLFATSCASVICIPYLPQNLILVLANGLIVLGITALYIAIRRFFDLPISRWYLLPTLLTIAIVIFFTNIYPSFKIRTVLVSSIWMFPLGASAHILFERSRSDPSFSRKILASIFCIAIIYVALRAIAYETLRIPPNYTIASNMHWLNIFTPIFLALLPVVGTTAFLLMCSDHLRRQLERAASTDYLTSLPNRRAFTEYGKSLFSQARRQNHDFVIATLDIDNFKSINDLYGHEAGDQVLMRLASLFAGHHNAMKLIARIGGEEFAIIFSDIDTAWEVAEKIRRDVEHARFRMGTSDLKVTVSIGLARINNDLTFESIMRRADTALYRAKASGRNRIEVASSGSETQAKPMPHNGQYLH